MLAAEPRRDHRGAPAPARLTVLSGPSGVGKSTVVARLRADCPAIWQSVSVTTRPPRPSEMSGREYHFVSEAEFAAMAERGELLESARFAGHHYGTPRLPVQEQLDIGKPALLEIDVAGARQVREAVPDALLVFLAPPSWAELERRLVSRNTESAEKVASRLDAARVELAAEDEFDITLVNTSVERVCAQLVALILGQDANVASGDARQGTHGNSELEGTQWQRLRP
ncbi:MAG TPA: guanylate kinase [Streptosporangiaceae bacterium]|nr:guanylate kinase [Streptosporangiaceae bacterium]